MADKIKEPRRCPYCDDEIAEAAFPYCEACSLATITCPKCGVSVAKNSETCPNCGVNIREEARKEC